MEVQIASPRWEISTSFLGNFRQLLTWIERPLGGWEEQRRRRQLPLFCPPAEGSSPMAKYLYVIVDEEDIDKDADATLTLAIDVGNAGWTEAKETLTASAAS